ncbi:MAG: Rpn family recombination-promoting nuclease/putative transposase [Gemmatimonadetes bacterium]|nr:Rpn family recombination-promoting nuclease/putative transposase [Gemmatimonadota bacterium]MYA11327.1 Rpn family recombination-promoting nuclease/putative transposase [Gemmatimonadota bacterium]MYE69891.1 Rpn family recombination-promoting nuclease/putative transposase [Gemmatimonadota bacterium]MYJ67727.1 Rpn family recombination-promoting nuclease/putative transposase [Gemmatimonadota bacterium]
MPGKRKRPDQPQHDAAYKNFFTHSQTVADTLRLAAGELARRLDFATLERLPASFVNKHLDQRHTDMLWRIGFTGGGWVYILILLEFQSTVDRRMALRVLDYTSTIWMRLGREDLGPDGEYPLVLPIVIYNGKSRWTAATDVGHLFGPVPEKLLGYQPRLRYLLIEIRSLDLDSLPPDNILAMIVSFEQAPTAQALEELAGSLADRPEAIEAPELVGAFAAWVMYVLTQRFGSAGRELRRKLRAEEEGTMSTLIERARKWGEERDQLWLQKGIEQERQASMQRERELVHRQVSRRFGPGTAEQLMQVLERISDPEGIVLVADAVVECETAEEFLKRVREG